MFEEYQICPYTGLRSFTEEESLYFKGREEHIEQATDQLQRNKFLMLTGASGDGKSSLVYAGIVPNARAGFLKSKYTQWCLADFRHESCSSCIVQTACDVTSPDGPAACTRDDLWIILDAHLRQPVRYAVQPRRPRLEAGLDLPVFGDIDTVPALPQRDLGRQAAS